MEEIKAEMKPPLSPPKEEEMEEIEAEIVAKFELLDPSPLERGRDEVKCFYQLLFPD